MASKAYPLLANVLIILLVEAFMCHAASASPKAYWNSVLPKTPMPAAVLSYLLDSSTDAKKSFQINKLRPTGNRNCYRCEYTHETKIPLSKKDFNAEDFLLEKDLQTGAELDLHFYTNSGSEGGFLAREAADSIPFSSNKLPELLRRFSIKPDTMEAQVMRYTIATCEKPDQVGEKKICPTSLESMVDFVTSTLGTRDVVAMSTTAVTNKGFRLPNLKQKYTILSPGVKELKAAESIACHPLTYPYAVFYCHKIESTKTYTVPLEGRDGTRLNAIVNCHIDTSSWQPGHVAFQVLNVKPGTPVCHFFPQDDIVWTPKN